MGYIYILSNKYYRHGKLLKIGMTSRTVERRAKELSGAFGVPDDFSIVFKKQVKFPSVAEKEIHKKLSSHRINRKREFFLVDEDSAIRIVNDTCSRINKKPNVFRISKLGRILIITLLMVLYIS
ncbi:TPA: GIY-YIG nuclease family protein [Aeromonas veronii]|nr:GIY-YIG nuclease family protein [Aeromonas veronii]